MSYAELRAAGFFSQNIVTIPGLRFLDVGCGNSTFGEDLVQAAREAGQPDLNLMSIDFSDECIATMKRRVSANRKERYMVMDIRDLEFQEDAFDYIIDKGTLDAMTAHLASACGTSTMSAEERRVVKAFQEIERVLYPGGTFLLISCKQVDFWTKYWTHCPKLGHVQQSRITTSVSGSNLPNPRSIQIFIHTLKHDT